MEQSPPVETSALFWDKNLGAMFDTQAKISVADFRELSSVLTRS